MASIHSRGVSPSCRAFGVASPQCGRGLLRWTCSVRISLTMSSGGRRPMTPKTAERDLMSSGPATSVLTDYVSVRQPDRFNNPLPEFGETRSLAASPDGRHAYVDTSDEGILIFERVGAGADETGLEDGAYTRLDMLSVSSGSVTFGPVSTAGCIGLEDAVIDGVHYSVAGSKWQTRASSDAEWADVEGTGTNGRLCAYAPPAGGEHRLAAEIRIDGEPGRYASNSIGE